MPQILTRYLGTIEYFEADVVRFPAGLPAFEEENEFLPIAPPASAPLVFLQSLRQQSLCFLALPVDVVDPHYQLDVSREDLLTLGLDPAHSHIELEIMCLALLAVTGNGHATANLLAPVIIHKVGRCGLQSIRVDSVYSHQHPVTRLSGNPEVRHARNPSPRR